MTAATKGVVLWGSVLALGIMMGLGIGWKIWRPISAKAETYAREQRQQDGSLMFERKPQADAKPAHQIPKGAQVERITQVQFRPAVATPQTSGPNPEILLPVPPPYTLDLTLVRMPDLTRRLIASSPDGEIVGGVDIPVEAAPEPRQLKWAAGVVYGGTAWGDKAVGVFVDRDFAFLRTGLELTKNTYTLPARPGWEARAKLGIRF